MANEPNTAAKPHPRNSLQSFSLANFKAFGANEQQIPLKPITLVFGPNSSGKSSIIQSLLMMHHATNTIGADLSGRTTTLGGQSMDLGGFWQYLHGQGKGPEEVHLAYSFTIQTLEGFRSPMVHSGMEISFELTISSQGTRNDLNPPPYIGAWCIKVDGEVLMQIESGARLRNETSIDGSPSFWMDAIPRTTARVTLWNPAHAVSAKVLQYCRDFAEPNQREFITYENLKQLVEMLELKAGAELFSTEFNDTRIRRTWLDDDFEWRSDDSLPTGITPSVEMAFKHYISNLLQDFRSLFTSEIERINYLGPLRTIPARGYGDILQGIDPSLGGNAWSQLKSEPSIRHRVNSWLGAEFLKTHYCFNTTRRYTTSTIQEAAEDYIRIQIPLFLAQLVSKSPEALQELVRLRDICHEKPYNSHLEWQDDVKLSATQQTSLRELITEQSVSLEAVAGEQKTLGDNRSIEQIKQAISANPEKYLWPITRHHILHSFEIANALDRFADPLDWANSIVEDLNSREQTSSDELVLTDVTNGNTVSLKDVGIGISQVLPILVHSFAEKSKLIAIEQPELHIHPALQAELGDLFIESAMERGNTFLIETHSEHLILRLLRRIRETTDGELEPGKVGLTPADICVLYVQPGKDGSKIMELPVTADGDFRVPWPGGFFAERATELFGPSTIKATP